jgi:ParB family transcriptional regulator, chromosome partitioning protein
VSAKKRGLGRGLDALIESKPTAEPAVTSLPVEKLKPNRLQPRTSFEETALAELAESIRAQGVVQPLVVTAEDDGTYSIVAGERRWRAAQRAGLAEVPVVVREVADDRQRLELALVENLQRADLNPIEEAEAYQALQGSFGLSQDEVAARVGKARTTVANSLRLLRLPEPVREMLRAGRLSAGQARPLLALPDPEAQTALAGRAAREGLTARQMEALTAEPKPAAAKPRPKPAEVEVHAAAAAETLTRRLQTRVEIQRQGKGGVLRIHYHSEEELMRLYELLMERGAER